MANLHMTLWDFYTYTPLDVDFALKAYFEKEKEDIKLQWEIARTHIYYEYLFVPTKKRKVSYETFKRDYLKLAFDEEKESQTEAIDDEQFAMIQNIMKQKMGTN